MQLRPYQSQFKNDIYAAWQRGARNIAGVLPTGGGKTVVYSNILMEEPGASVIMAHRHELVSQTSLALARNGVRHRIIGQPVLVRWCQRQSILETGGDFVNQNARCAAASVDTLKGLNTSDPWFSNVRLWVCDETHHLQAENKWGKATKMFPNARGLGVTATLERADGRGLGRPDGLLDEIVTGPSMRELINQGFLVDYKVFSPPSDIDLSSVNITAGGDFSPAPLRKAVRGSHILGDVVKHYLALTPGQLGITFCVDVQAATDMARSFRAAGVSAEVVTGETPLLLRSSLMQRFGKGEFRQLCVVDVVSEGTDIPAVDVISLARPSASYSLIAQQVGRVLRPKEGKTLATIIDHVGNIPSIARLGFCPTSNRHTVEIDRAEWTLERRERRGRGVTDAAAVRTCPECLGDYPVVMGRTCPFCSETTLPADRSAPEMVDGDLAELSPEALAKIQGEIDRIVGVAEFPGAASNKIRGSIYKMHEKRRIEQGALRQAMAHWGGARKLEGVDTPTAQRMFFHKFKIDVGTAQTLGQPEAESLKKKVLKSMGVTT